MFLKRFTAKYVRKRICAFAAKCICAQNPSFDVLCFSPGYHMYRKQLQELCPVFTNLSRPELGAYGAAHVHSPNIDALAAKSVLFERMSVHAQEHTRDPGSYDRPGHIAKYARYRLATVSPPPLTRPAPTPRVFAPTVSTPAPRYGDR